MNNNNSISQLRAAWSLVIQRVTQHSVEVWIGSLSKGIVAPIEAQLVVKSQGQRLHGKVIRPVDWAKPFSGVSQGFYTLCRFDALLPRQHYHLELHIRPRAADDVMLVATGEFDCLPSQLPTQSEHPFTIALGSCFSNQGDDGQVSTAYQALYRNPEYRPDITFLAGDQVYLDIGFDSLNPIASMIRKRIANDYARQWQGLAGIFRSGGTWMLPDDHEYWNDYPFNDQPILALQALKLKSVRRAWLGAARDGVMNIQRTQLLEFIRVGDELSICLADLRSARTAHGFLPDAVFSELTAWARHLNCPGVLVLPQILIDRLVLGERNLLNFRSQYIALLEALAASGNDIVLMSGDVHFGRIAKVALGNSGARLIEIVASPLSNLRGYLNGFATAVAEQLPEFFPDPNSLSIPGWQPAPVDYDSAFNVPHQCGKRFSRQPLARTHEHFMTVSFAKQESGQVQLQVQAWSVRNLNAQGHPQPLFKQPFCMQLKSRRNESRPVELREDATAALIEPA